MIHSKYIIIEYIEKESIILQSCRSSYTFVSTLSLSRYFLTTNQLLEFPFHGMDVRLSIFYIHFGNDDLEIWFYDDHSIHSVLHGVFYLFLGIHARPASVPRQGGELLNKPQAR